MIVSDKLSDYDYSSHLEWLETNGLGGYASSSVTGSNTRRYHGLLVAALHPPVDRMVMISKLDETIIVNDKRVDLGTNQYPGTLHPQGYQYLKSVERDLFPVFIYEAEGIQLKKTIAAIQGENTTLVLYEVTKAPAAFILELLPFYSCRDFHSLSHANDSISRHYLFDDGLFRTLNYERCPEIFIQIPGAQFIESKNWYYNVEYAVEQYRGLDYKEDLYSHGKFSVTLNKGDKLGIILSTENPTGRDVFSLFSKEKKRREALVKKEATPDVKRLILASDQFIVKRGKLKTIIAGYHWFADWGRDTMISLPGLCLVTGRYNDAKNILKAFASSVSEGMLPNRFSDYGEAPEYNTVDATLWFFHAIYKYYCYTKDIDFIKKMLPILQDIIAWHIKGTRYSIKVDPHDLLLNAGEEGVQLTWMDAKVGDWVVTPRRGKAVEINALWYNALCSLSELLKEAGQTTEADQYIKQSRIVIESFNNQFWNEQQQCLYDCIDGDYKNDDLRPNQLYAISLPFPLLPSLKAKQVLDKVTANLLTPRGLRSLASTNQGYCPDYGGSPWRRDGAYHQGTVWSFLIGPYIDALLYVDKNAKIEATDILKTFLLHLDEACLGSVSEIFDGEAPYNPRGCVAQAWGVAEVLRVIREYDLM